MRDFMMDDLDKIICDMFDSSFKKDGLVKFKSGYTQDMSPITWKVIRDKDGNKIGYTAVCRAVGINEDDVKIRIEDNGLYITAKTKFKEDGFAEDEYAIDYFFPIVDNVLADIKDVKYKTKNGLVYIKLSLDEPKIKKINIEKM